MRLTFLHIETMQVYAESRESASRTVHILNEVTGLYDRHRFVRAEDVTIFIVSNDRL